MANFRVEATVQAIRTRIARRNAIPVPISTQQQAAQNVSERKGSFWLSEVTLLAPQDESIRQMLFQSVQRLSEEQTSYTEAQLAPVKAEWIGHRRDGRHTTSEAKSPRDEYDGLMQDVSCDLTMIHVHGGGF